MAKVFEGTRVRGADIGIQSLSVSLLRLFAMTSICGRELQLSLKHKPETLQKLYFQWHKNKMRVCVYLETVGYTLDMVTSIYSTCLYTETCGIGLLANLQHIL